MDPIVCLAIASAILGLIQANNPSDGGMGALLTATLDYQRIMSKQLNGIQQQLDLLLEEVMKIDEKLRKGFREDRLRALRDSIGEVAITYRDWNAEAVRGYSSYQELQTSNVMRGGLLGMRKELDSTMAKLEKASWFDSMTVLHIALAANLSLAIRSALGEPIGAVAANAQRFLNFLASAENPNESGSIPSELAQKEKTFNALRSGDVLKPIFDELPEGGFKVVVLHAPVRLIEYEPYYPPVTEMTESGRKILEDEIPERWGLGNEYGMSVIVRERDVNGVKQYETDDSIRWDRDPISPSDYRATDTRVPFDWSEGLILAPFEVLAEAKRKELSLALAQYNAVIVQICVCWAALANAAATRQSLLNSFGGGKLRVGLQS